MEISAQRTDEMKDKEQGSRRTNRKRLMMARRCDDIVIAQ